MHTQPCRHTSAICMTARQASRQPCAACSVIVDQSAARAGTSRCRGRRWTPCGTCSPTAAGRSWRWRRCSWWRTSSASASAAARPRCRVAKSRLAIQSALPALTDAACRQPNCRDVRARLRFRPWLPLVFYSSVSAGSCSVAQYPYAGRFLPQICVRCCDRCTPMCRCSRCCTDSGWTRRS